MSSKFVEAPIIHLGNAPKPSGWSDGGPPHDLQQLRYFEQLDKENRLDAAGKKALARMKGELPAESND